MSWFGSADPVAQLDRKIEGASSESIPNGELDVAIALEITDDIRSKKVQPTQAMRSLKKRLTKVYTNPNLLTSTLKLCDMCVKNGGGHFLKAIDTREFVTYLVDVIFKVHYDTKSLALHNDEAKVKIGTEILTLIQEWDAYLGDKVKDDSVIKKEFKNLKNQGYRFPPLDPLIKAVAANFVDSEAPPDWIDGKECMICYNAFSVVNRKHHCRACGGVFCQAHSSKTLSLVSLGILIPVRVCDDCYLIHKKNAYSVTQKKLEVNLNGAANHSNTRADEDEQDEDLKKAIELSLKETQIQALYNTASQDPPPVIASKNEDDLDEDLKAAIEASLADHKAIQAASQPTGQLPSQPNARAPEPELDFYLNLMPLDINAYAQAPSTQFSQYGSPAASNVQDASFQRAPAPTVEASGPKKETLTEQDEENINLFVQLMNGVRGDRFKQANILHDRNLNELHAKVVRLKPKLNRSLRDAIEKYECFLEMNNKINSITRLYDQYLEDMLNNAYNKHSIVPPNKHNYSPYPTSNDAVLSHGDSREPDVKSEYLRQQSFFQSPQISASQKSYWNEPHQNQHQIPRQRPHSEQTQGSQKVEISGHRIASATTPYSVSDIIPSDLNVSSYNRQRSSSMYPVDSDTLPEIPSPTFNDQELGLPQVQSSGAYPQEPSSPPEDESDMEDNESVSSRFPPVESLYDAVTPQKTDSLQKPAAMRFPSLSQIEKVEDDVSEAESSSVITRPKSEPAPLIEL